MAFATGDARPARRIALRVAVGFLVLLVVFALPARPEFAGAPRLPVEWLWAVGLLAFVRGRAFALLSTLVLTFAAASAVLKLADWGTLSAFSRPFDPVVDCSIVVAGWHLLSGTIGQPRALLVLCGAIAAFLAIVSLLAWGLAGLRRMPGRVRGLVGAAALAAALAGTLALHRSPASALPLTAELSSYAQGKVSAARHSFAMRAAFAQDMAVDPLADDAPDGLLAALAGRDVLLVFVESYGRSVVEDPRFAPRTLGRLQQVETALSAVGVSARSGWMGSPIAGGQSWLAHGTLLSGLAVTDQIRYQTLLASDRDSLNALFRKAGWRTVAVMPAITMPWPEAGWFGYDEVLAAQDLGYRGPPFNWVTMPDQFTLHRIGEVLNRSKGPVMLQTALISSHAPWTPVPHMVPWEGMGDGAVFDAQARSGETPDALWRDHERVRRNYAQTIDYALEAVGSFVAHFAKDAVVIVVGDHQPAELVTGPDASRDVPLHILSNDPAVLRRLDGWGMAAGMIPAPETPSVPMSAFRERFVRAMSGETPGS